MPPSGNSLYFVKGGRKILSRKGRMVKQRLKSIITRTAATTCIPDALFRLEIHLFFKAVENKGWCSGKAKTRYKRIDVSNRVKLLEDALSEATGVDDSLFFQVCITKHATQREDKSEHCTITLRRYDE
jgi:Holliday junction resolvase RusA-like endonuclease